MLTERLNEMRDFSQARLFKQYRSYIHENYMRTLRKLNLDFTQRSAFLLSTMCAAEDPIVFPDEKISFIRTKINLPQYYDLKTLKQYYGEKKGIVFEPFHNVCPDYSILLNEGLEAKRIQAEQQLCLAKTKKEKIFLESIIKSINSVLDLARRYEIVARANKNDTVANLFARVPRHAANSLHEALQSIRFISSMIG